MYPSFNLYVYNTKLHVIEGRLCMSIALSFIGIYTGIYLTTNDFYSCFLVGTSDVVTIDALLPCYFHHSGGHRTCPQHNP